MTVYNLLRSRGLRSSEARPGVVIQRRLDDRECVGRRHVQRSNVSRELGSALLKLPPNRVAIPCDEGAVSAAGLDYSVAFELPVCARHGIRGDPEVTGQFSNRRQSGLGRQLVGVNELEQLHPQLLEWRHGRAWVDEEHDQDPSPIGLADLPTGVRCGVRRVGDILCLPSRLIGFCTKLAARSGSRPDPAVGTLTQ